MNTINYHPGQYSYRGIPPRKEGESLLKNAAHLSNTQISIDIIEEEIESGAPFMILTNYTFPDRVVDMNNEKRGLLS